MMTKEEGALVLLSGGQDSAGAPTHAEIRYRIHRYGPSRARIEIKRRCREVERVGTRFALRLVRGS